MLLDIVVAALSLYFWVAHSRQSLSRTIGTLQLFFYLFFALLQGQRNYRRGTCRAPQTAGLLLLLSVSITCAVILRRLLRYRLCDNGEIAFLWYTICRFNGICNLLTILDFITLAATL